MRQVLLVLLVCVAASCGGQQSDAKDGTHKNTSDLDVDKGKNGVASVADAGMDTSQLADAAPPAPPVTFVIKNSHSEDLVFNMDRGWQPVIFGYSGEPGKGAKPIVMFEKYCTAACGSEQECPTCATIDPMKVREIRAAEKREVVVPGATLEVPWDGQVFSYKDVKRRKKAKCECFEKRDPEPAEYTVQVCGLRVTKSAKQRSTYQCAKSAMTLPSESPIRVEVDFGDPEPPKKPKKHGR